MSRMMAPEMEVVRFQEADVIVASGYNGPILSFSNFGNGDARDNIANLSGATSGDGNYYLGTKPEVNAFVAALTGAGLDDSGLNFIQGARADDDDATFIPYNNIRYGYENGVWKRQ